MKSVCVFCGSNVGRDPAYLNAAVSAGETLARAGLTLVYGGGKVGLMGAVADAALAAGGEVIGVIPEMFHTPQLAHTGLTRLEIVESMHQRKERLATQADAFIALPGGFGTFEELFEILTWAQIGLHQKPVGLLNTLHYYDLLVKTVDYARLEGFIYDEHRALFVCEEEPEALLDKLENYRAPSGLERWLTRPD